MVDVITVFTPTYNRAYIIHNLYNSLRCQSCKKFEWLIIDDGSEDDTEELLKRWMIDENDFSIRYYRQENGGKCRAINRALDLAKGELFFTVDSDDYLTEDAVEKIIKWESELPAETKYCGFAGNLGTSVDETPNTLLKLPWFDGNALDRYGIIDGERAMVFYTEIHRKYRYPVFENEKFMTEAVAWNRMAADGYKMRFYNDIIWIYEYQEDGLTKAGNTLFLKNPQGYGLWLKEKAKFQRASLIDRIKLYYSFNCDLRTYISKRRISEYISAPFILIVVLDYLYKIKQLFRK